MNYFYQIYVASAFSTSSSLGEVQSALYSFVGIYKINNDNENNTIFRVYLGWLSNEIKLKLKKGQCWKMLNIILIIYVIMIFVVSCVD